MDIEGKNNGYKKFLVGSKDHTKDSREKKVNRKNEEGTKSSASLSFKFRKT